MSKFTTFKPSRTPSKALRPNTSKQQRNDTDNNSTEKDGNKRQRTESVIPETSQLSLQFKPSLSINTTTSNNADDDEDIFNSTLFSTTAKGRVAKEADPVAATLPDFVPEEHHYMSSRFSSVPLDWCLYSKLRFTSAIPFEWTLERATKDEFFAQRHFLDHPLSPPPSTLSATAALQSSLSVWSFPSYTLHARHPATAPIKEANMKSADLLTSYDQLCISYFNKRWQQWEQSFISLYHEFRSYNCPHFYVVVDNKYVILFVNDQQQEQVAVISKTTKQFRSDLTKKGVSFTMPNYTPPSTTSAASTLDDDLIDTSSKLRSFPSSTVLRKQAREQKEIDSTPASVIVIQGRKDVHSLYDVLLNQEKRHGKQAFDDVPTLVSPIPFQHSALQTAEITKVGEIARSAAITASSTTTFCFDVQGFLAPWNVIKLLTVMERHQKDYEVRLTSSYPSSNLNTVTALPVLQKYGPEEVSPICMKPEVQRAMVNTISTNRQICLTPVVKRVKCSHGKYQVELESKTAQ